MEKEPIVSKATITRVFIASGIAIIAGSLATIAAIWLAIVNDAFVMTGPDIVGLHLNVQTGALLSLAFIGALGVGAGFIGGFLAWIGALLNTWQLDRRAWFVGLLLLGVFNLGFFAMVAYLLAGPDSAQDVGSAALEPIAA